MKKLAFLTITLFTVLLSSCSSLESDAKEAAALNIQSLEYIKEQELEKAEEVYKEAQEIIARYKETEKYLDFYKIYSEQMLKETSNKE
ncbi:hypothetical protein [Dysgonomonas sp. Marseille-P4361]|uniref:hypothetical protein n=1 Tax=Dysgonomonas sp. Marseille-P4361 TaxID=2161820 RepID=UPI000D556A05|nr:hypothetical protein [Dysgonomonas sp. Marseille-P4361]